VARGGVGRVRWRGADGGRPQRAAGQEVDWPSEAPEDQGPPCVTGSGPCGPHTIGFTAAHGRAF